MKVLVACEFSGIVRDAFIMRGHDAMSCDLLPTERPGPHYQGDIIEFINGDTGFCICLECYEKCEHDHNSFWCDYCRKLYPLFCKDEYRKFDLMIAHPPCTYLTVARNKYYKKEYKDRFPNQFKDRRKAIEFFLLLASSSINKIAIENPVGIMSTRYRKPDQIIQPYQFGHTERKATCLWLKNLPKLKPTNIIDPVIIKHKSGRTCSHLHYETLKLSPEERQKKRSRTFQGIADAMAEQWG